MYVCVCGGGGRLLLLLVVLLVGTGWVGGWYYKRVLGMDGWLMKPLKKKECTWLDTNRRARQVRASAFLKRDVRIETPQKTPKDEAATNTHNVIIPYRYGPESASSASQCRWCLAAWEARRRRRPGPRSSTARGRGEGLVLLSSSLVLVGVVGSSVFIFVWGGAGCYIYIYINMYVACVCVVLVGGC